MTAITTAMDREMGFERLGTALLEIDEGIGPMERGAEGAAFFEEGSCIYSRPNAVAMTISEAMDGRKKSIALKESAGSISGEFVYIYPPGIPVLVPGEYISKEILHLILSYIDKKLPVQGVGDIKLQTIRIVDRE